MRRDTECIDDVVAEAESKKILLKTHLPSNSSTLHEFASSTHFHLTLLHGAGQHTFFLLYRPSLTLLFSGVYSRTKRDERT